MTIIKRIRAIIGALCIVVTLVSSRAAGQELPTAKPEDVGVSPDKVEELSTFMQSLIDDGKIAGGVTMFARRGKVVHFKAVGMADREAKKPMKTDAIFRIASMTKPITSVAAMILYEEGKLDLDDPVSKYIPEFEKPKVIVSVNPLVTKPATREITIRHLLTHTSGLGYPQTPIIGPIYQENGILSGLRSTDVTLEVMMKRLARLPIQFDPGTQWQYGFSTDVLGRVIEVVSGKELDEFFSSKICGPLGMKDTFFIVPPHKRSRVATAYVPLESQMKELDFGVETTRHDIPISSDYHLDGNKYFSGGGGLCSTASDFMRFCQMLLNGGELNGVRLLKEDTVKSMIVDQTGELACNFGFGFRICDDTPTIHAQLKGMYSWAGFWTTCFRVSPRGDWILITMSQLAWPDDAIPVWFVEYEKIAAQSIMNGAPQ